MNKSEKLIRKYFLLGLQQKEILHFLYLIHSIKISSRTLKRILNKLQLHRRKNYTSIEKIVKFLEEEISRSGQMHGYRWMHLKCLQNGMVVTQEIVRELLHLLDPVGVDFRKRKRLRRRIYSNKGPNYLWHVDSYDKLKPYGICINGCIDGYSRHIIWLHAARSSSDPKVIAGYYINALKTLGGCPQTIRSDMGTENKTIERFQKTLCELMKSDDYENHRPTYLYGRSTSNQRIESWWSILRKQNAQYWINLFEILRDGGHYSGTFLDKSLIQLCFLDIIQDELNQVAFEWNVHKIRNSRNSNSPRGRPVIMYEMPSLYNARNYAIEVPEILLHFLEEKCTYYRQPCDKDVYNLCNDILMDNHYTLSKDPYDAVQQYIFLRQEISTLLD